MSAEIEDMLKRFQAIPNIFGIIVVNEEGIPIKSTIDNATSVQYAAQMGKVTFKAMQILRKFDVQNELKAIRMRTNKHEIFIVPEEKYFIIVLQNPSD